MYRSRVGANKYFCACLEGAYTIDKMIDTLVPASFMRRHSCPAISVLREVEATLYKLKQPQGIVTLNKLVY